MRIALGQLDSTDDRVANLEKVRSAVRRGAAAGAELVLLPEYAMYEKKVVDHTFAHVAEPLDGPFVQELSALAVECGVAVVAGAVERNDEGDRPFNTLVAVAPDGSLTARYRKIHLFDSYGFSESSWIAPAPEPEIVTFEMGALRVGLMACYDLRFPELARALALAGADLIAVCSSWVPGPGKTEQWRVLAQARAIENGCFVAGVSQAAPISIGNSLVASPMGELVGRLGETPDLLVVDIDPGAVTAARERDPALLRRRVGIASA